MVTIGGEQVTIHQTGDAVWTIAAGGLVRRWAVDDDGALVEVDPATGLPAGEIVLSMRPQSLAPLMRWPNDPTGTMAEMTLAPRCGMVRKEPEWTKVGNKEYFGGSWTATERDLLPADVVSVRLYAGDQWFDVPISPKPVTAAGDGFQFRCEWPVRVRVT